MTPFIPQEYVPVLLKIYNLTVLKKEKVTFSTLVEYFPRKEVCVALEYLCRKCVIADKWDKPEGRWIQSFEIELQYVQFVEKLKGLGVGCGGE